jgi:F420-non-reducing hydrogenase large subunit
MMTLTFPLSRIEGHARVVIEVDNGRVFSARFQATEIRGFDQFVKGVPAIEMPVITPRICGVCSTAHHLAAVKALEDAFGVMPPQEAAIERELLMLGQLIQNQATSLFIFTMPDRLGLPDLFRSAAEDLVDELREEFTDKAISIRKIGTDLISLAGGQFIHPIKTRIGGMTANIDHEQATVMLERINASINEVRRLVDYYYEQSIALKNRLGTWGDDAPACYISSIAEQNPDFTGGLVGLLDTKGMTQRFKASEFRRYLTYRDSDYSYAGQTDYFGDVIRANSLARMNMTKKLGTKIADQYHEEFAGNFGRPAHGILLFDLARGIELIYAIEKSAELLTRLDHKAPIAVAYDQRDGEGYGIVEAPRGPLIHHYVVEKGLISSAEFIIPSVHNVLAIERALRVAAEKYIKGDAINTELERAVGRVVRAFDPCIACATH